MDFMYQGTPVETVIRSMAVTRSVVEDCVEGRFTITPASWTTNGYYSYIYLAEFGFLKPIDDATGYIDACRKLITPFPPKLKAAIVRTFYARGSMWLYNFHYDSAIARADVLFTAGLVKNMIYDLTQVIFALNETYFVGDKRLAQQLSAQSFCPSELLSQLPLLLSAPADTEMLAEQRTILRRVAKEIDKEINRQGLRI
jgi:hypothetical protein